LSNMLQQLLIYLGSGFNKFKFVIYVPSRKTDLEIKITSYPCCYLNKYKDIHTI